MKLAASIVIGLVLAIAGTVAIGGSSYAPPAASAGVSGSGSGITDAAAFRSSLGLGTAATASTGTAMGNVVALGMGATLPVVNGGNLTGISSSQISGLGTAAGYSAGSFQAADDELSAIASLTSSADQLPYFTGSGTAALASFSTAGRALVDDADAAAQRTTLGLGTAATTASTAYQAADAELAALAGLTSAADAAPYFTGSGTASTMTVTTAGRALLDDATAVDMRTTLGLGTTSTTDATAYLEAYAADSWDYEWTTATGDPLSNGWSNGGTYNATTASTTQGGVSCYSITMSASSGTSFISRSVTAAAGDWELRMKIYMPASQTSPSVYRMPVFYVPNNTAYGTKRLEFYLTTAGVAYGIGTTGNATLLTATPAFYNRWIDLTLRMRQSADGIANSWFEAWVGKVQVYNALIPDSPAAFYAAGTLGIGKLSSTAQTGPFYIASVRFKNGINAAPPSYTFRNEVWPL